MKLLNIFWVGICLVVLSGICDQIGWNYAASGMALAAVITMIGIIVIALHKNT